MTRIAPTALTPGNSGTNNLQLVDAASRSRCEQRPAYSKKVAQVVPPGTISGGPNKIPQARTDAIIVGSIDPKISFQPGGAAGLGFKVTAPLVSAFTRTRVVNVGSPEGMVKEIAAQKKLNNGQALSRITIEAHGDSGVLMFANSLIYRVSQVVQPIMAARLLKPGGRLVLTGCSVAKEAQACAELSQLAQKYKIVIQASEMPTAFGSENLAHMTFYPDGKTTRNMGPFAPF